jgi:hypothetical protein
MLALLAPAWCQTVTWCVDTPKLRIGIATVPATHLQEADLKIGQVGPELMQIYAGED